MTTPIACGDLPAASCAQMGALALFVPFFLGAALTESLAWSLGSATPWALVACVGAGLSLLGVAVGLWVRARYQQRREAPALWWLVLSLALALSLGGLALLPALRVLGWSLALWVGLRWLPKAIWQIGSMC
jgi:hypothetical protein